MIPELQEMIDDFTEVENQTERMDMLSYYASDYRGIPESVATKPYNPANRVPECMTTVASRHQIS